MAPMKARNWAVTLGLSTTIALTGCGTSNPASTPSQTQESTVLNASEMTPEAASSSSKPGETAQATETGAEPATGALTETYTSPDGSYSVKYPASWKSTTDKGYLELTSPSGAFTGRIATTDVRPATEEWFTTTKTMVDGVNSPITEQLGSKVSTYSAYVHSPESADKDLALYGLTQVNSSGMVSLLENTGKAELWVEITATPPTVTNQALSHEEAKDILNTMDTTFPDVPTVKAILQSIRLGDAAVSVG